MAGQPDQLRLSRAVRAAFSDRVMPFPSLISHMTCRLTAGLLVDLD